MSSLKILEYPNPELAKVSDPVDSFDKQLKELVQNMFETMYLANGIGLAAPQIAQLKRLTVIDVSEKRDQPQVFINPSILWSQGSVPSEEGCLSIPDYRDTITRSAEILVSAQDTEGKKFEVKAEGLLAVCLQHEIDHLDGILFTDRLSRLKREMFKRWFRKKQKDLDEESK